RTGGSRPPGYPVLYSARSRPRLLSAALFPCLLGFVVLIGAGPAWAWWPAGHSILSKAAVKALPGEVPQFFRAGGGMIGHCAQDPDVAKNREAPNLNDEESPEHYLDFELLQGSALPPTRYAF